MNITPKDILDKEFSKKMNGYDQEQVDEFLDEIIKQFESLLEENENIIAKNEQLKTDLAKLKVKADKMDDIEEKLMSTVIAAQRNATIYIERAEEQAKSIMDIANENAKTVIESTQLRMEVAQQELKKYENLIGNYKKKYRTFLEEQYAALDVKAGEANFIDHKAAEISQSINRLTEQVKALDEENAKATIHLNEILRQHKDAPVPELDLGKSTENLQDIVSEIIDDKK